MLTADDKQRAQDFLSQVTVPLTEVMSMSTELVNLMKNGDLITNKGLSFLDVKNHLMLSYMINLTHLMGEKLRGKSIRDSAAVNRLVEIRTVLEKMRPIDQKLKYQIERLVRTAKMGVVADDDPMRLKPNIDNLADESGDDENDSADDDQKSKQIYKPAKLAPVYYDGDETAKQKKERQMDVVKKRLAKSAAVRDLHREYTDAPEEIRETADIHRLKEDRIGLERQEYEEKYFIRMSATKKDKAVARQMRTMSSLDSITKFGDLNFITGRDSGAGKKRKKEHGGKKHKGSSSKRRKFRK